jgi:protocatechuate 3,4-dioxygenase beta subunit
MVYARPGQVTVFGVVLDTEGAPVSDIALAIEVTDPNGDTVFNAEVTTGLIESF